MKFPAIKDVARDLKNIARQISKYGLPEVEEGGCDVRLQVLPDGGWSVHSGDAQYDQDHRGYWGASSLPYDGHFNATEVAKDLIEQAKDAAAQDESDKVPNLDTMWPMTCGSLHASTAARTKRSWFTTRKKKLEPTSYVKEAR